MSSFRRRMSAQKNKRKNGRRDKNEFETRHSVNVVKRSMMKDKSDKYRLYEPEDI